MRKRLARGSQRLILKKGGLDECIYECLCKLEPNYPNDPVAAILRIYGNGDLPTLIDLLNRMTD